MSTSEGHHEYIGGCSLHWGQIMMYVGDIMSTSGYVPYIGDIISTSGDSMTYVGSKLVKTFQFLLKAPMY